MNDLAIFTPIQNANAQENLDEFIRFAKEDLTVFGVDLDFESNSWDVTQYVDLKANKKKYSLVFTGFEAGHNIKSTKLSNTMQEPFLSFSKAHVRYMFGLAPVKGISDRVLLLRCVYRALIELADKNPIFINADIANRASQLCIEKYTPAFAYRLGGQLEKLIEFLSSKKMLLAPFQWRNPIRRPSDAQRIGEEADKRREDKMPSQAALDALPQVFRMATRDIHVIVSATTAILLASPDRINEVLRLEEKCESIRKNKDGAELYGLRWRGSKGADSAIKDIVSSMVDVVKEALNNIRNKTKAAREVANWYEDNPTRVFLRPESESLRTKDLLSSREVANILWGIDRASPFPQFPFKFKKIEGEIYVEFKTLENWVISKLPRGFPILDNDSGLKYSEALYVALKSQFRGTEAAYICAIETIDVNKINSYLGGRSSNGITSIFDAFDFFEPNGDHIVVTTHQFRHYLNTLALAGGMSEIEVSKWSGRKDIKQTSAYDHRSSSEIVQQIRDAIGNPDKSFGPISRLGRSNLITRDQISRLVVETVHTTDIGYCLHNFVASPCQLHLDCINCQEMVCIKGDKKAQDSLRLRLEESNTLLKQSQAAVDEGFFGADRWLSHQMEVNKRYKQLNELLDNPTILNGTVIQLSKPKTLIKQEKLKLENKNEKN